MSHTVTITRLPDATSDDYAYEFGGSHGPDCEVYRPCPRAACQRMDPDHPAGDERLRHSVHHEYREGHWLVVTDECALGFVFEAVSDIDTFTEAGVGLGTYPVVIQWEDENWWLEVQPPTTETKRTP